MTYYAVTEDPTELMHYGIKGMKWGVIRTDAQLGHPKTSKPRSTAYRKASSKLSKMMKSGIKKAEASWQNYNSPASKRARAKKREARQMDRALQAAREGRLKARKLSDAQIQKITDRLMLEERARQLGGREKSNFGRRFKSAFGEGIVNGVSRGTTAYIEERARGRGRTTAEFKADKRRARYEANQRIQRRKARNEANQEYFREMANRGELESKTQSIAKIVANPIINPHEGFSASRNQFRNLTNSGRQKMMREIRSEQKERERTQRQEEARDKAYYQALGKKEAEKQFKLEGSSNGSSKNLPTKKPSHPVKAPSGNTPTVTQHKTSARRNSAKRADYRDVFNERRNRK